MACRILSHFAFRAPRLSPPLAASRTGTRRGAVRFDRPGGPGRALVSRCCSVLQDYRELKSEAVSVEGGMGIERMQVKRAAGGLPHSHEPVLPETAAQSRKSLHMPFETSWRCSGCAEPSHAIPCRCRCLASARLARAFVCAPTIVANRQSRSGRTTVTSCRCRTSSAQFTRALAPAPLCQIDPTYVVGLPIKSHLLSGIADRSHLLSGIARSIPRT